MADAQITDLLQEFDEKVAPLALGKTSRTGEGMEAFLELLDAQNKPLEGKKALLRKPGRKAGSKSERRVRADDCCGWAFYRPKNAERKAHCTTVVAIS
ncbi:hypothetical protein [Leisingera aquimarina]|uniref:hypothetical protein n=1 Tax=Leisingera aquimarina TaxID=476529 RepID=UPI00040B9F3C|nr:hypothetical protein [Leisingera aquimarina]